MRRDWAKLPPLMQRTLADDLRWALFVIAGALLGYVLLGGGDAAPLLGCIAGALVAIVVLNVVRRMRRGP
jgi:ribose/xylose/arabinose/galactoside ABC-type transport system permease subunit